MGLDRAFLSMAQIPKQILSETFLFGSAAGILGICNDSWFFLCVGFFFHCSVVFMFMLARVPVVFMISR